jgi:hypothetical protein
MQTLQLRLRWRWTEECRHRLTKGSQLLHGLFMEAGVDLETSREGTAVYGEALVTLLTVGGDPQNGGRGTSCVTGLIPCA